MKATSGRAAVPLVVIIVHPVLKLLFLLATIIVVARVGALLYAADAAELYALALHGQM